MEALRTNTRVSLSNILVPTDFSPVSKAALSCATALASQHEADLPPAHRARRMPTLPTPFLQILLS